ncbi:MAG: pilus assembly PilX N-terminal domain-containing protein [Candidatus Omnitrophica bacterium]|nr:pilus assembly PilX N-terminal domain-containing protein [Candidatus Omnitrophota bacterium]
MNNKGIALLLSLIIMVILLVLGGAYMYMVRLEAYISKNQRNSTEALYIAEAGMERGIRYFVDLKGSWTGTLGPEYLDTANTKKYTVVSGTSPLGTDWRTLTSTGVILEPGTGVELAKRILQADVSIVAFKYALLSNEDINRSTAYGNIDGRIHANRMVYLDPARMTMDAGQPEPSMPRVLMPQIDMSYYADSNNFTGTGLTHSLIPNDQSFGAPYLTPVSDTVYYIKGIASIYTTDQDVTFTNCVLVAEGRVAAVGSDASSPWTTLVTSDDISDFSASGWATVNGVLFNYASRDASNFYTCTGDATQNSHFIGETVAQVNASQTTTAVILFPPTTTLTLQSTTGFLYPAGSAFIEGDSFTYTGIDRATNTLTGCSGFDSDHPIDVYVTQPQDGIVIKGREIICVTGSPRLKGVKGVLKRIEFQIQNVTLYNVVLDKFSATWTDTPTLTKVEIPNGTVVWTGSYAKGSPSVSFSPSYNSIVGSQTTIAFEFDGDMSISGATQLIATFYEQTYNTSYEVNLAIQGVKVLNFTVPLNASTNKADYPAMATKLGNIREFGSQKRSDRVVNGVAYSEQGRVQFDNVGMAGAIVSNGIDLINKNENSSATGKIDIDNYSVPAKRYVPDPAPLGFTGGLTIINWREVY